MASQRRLLSLRSASRPPSRPLLLPPPVEPTPEPKEEDVTTPTSLDLRVSRVERRVDRIRGSQLDRLIDERIGIRLDQEFVAAQRHRRDMLDAVGMLALALCAIGLVCKGYMMLAGGR